MDPFEFDCPQDFYDLGVDNFNNDFEWFQRLHHHHEISLNQIKEDLLTQSKTVVPLIQFHKKAKNSSKGNQISTFGECHSAMSPCKQRGQKRSPDHSAQEAEKQMLLMLRRHNEKFTPTSKYEPPRHSVREVRKWEKLTGRDWSSLSSEERVLANHEISQLKGKFNPKD